MSLLPPSLPNASMGADVAAGVPMDGVSLADPQPVFAGTRVSEGHAR